jgi:hypothetical protein
MVEATQSARPAFAGAPITSSARSLSAKGRSRRGRVAHVEDEVNGRHGVERAKRGPQEIPERTLGVAIMISPVFGGITTWTSSRRVPSAMAKRAAVRAAAADRSESSMPQMVDPPRLVAIDR